MIIIHRYENVTYEKRDKPHGGGWDAITLLQPSNVSVSGVQGFGGVPESSKCHKHDNYSPFVEQQ